MSNLMIFSDRRGGSGGPPQQGEDGWQNVNTRTKQNILDPTKTKFTKVWKILCTLYNIYCYIKITLY